MRILRLLAAIAVVSCGTASAQSPAPHVWDAQIMPQPFDTAAFHQIAIPDWVQETIGCGYTLSVMDRAAREAAVAHGVTITEMGFVNPYFACYDSQYLQRRDPVFNEEHTRAEIAEYDRLGLRILGVYPPSLQGEVYELHPEWRRIATDTTEIPTIDLEKYPHGGMLCLLGPYGDFFIDVLAEILEKFPQVDAFSFDGLHYGGVCYCEHCRDNYRHDTGLEIPQADLNDPHFRRYQHWADRRMEGLIQRMQERLKGINPEVALVTWTTNAGRFGHFLSIPRNMPARMNLLLDSPDQEFWLDETNRGLTVVPAFANAYVWAVTNHRVAFSEPYLMSHGNPYGKDGFPPEEILQRMLLALTYGAAPSLAVLQPPALQPEIYNCLDEVQRRKPWLTHKRPEPWAALLMSDNTRNFYGRSPGEVEERYLSHVLGTFRAAVESHLPLTVINDWNLNAADLAGQRVLILPNAACLDEQQLAAAEEYVRGGGGLVASLETSLCDEYGDPRVRPALEDLLGVQIAGVWQQQAGQEPLDVNFALGLSPDYWQRRKNVFDLRLPADSPLLSGRLVQYIGADAVTFKGPALRVTPREDGQVWATLALKTDASAQAPAIVVRQHGQGRVVYLAAGLDAAYYQYSYPYQRHLLRQVIEWAAQAPPPVQVTAPQCVHATVMRQQHEGERLVVHLYNDLNTRGGHALPVDDVPLREEQVPLFELPVVFRSDYPIRRVHWEPSGEELAVEETAEGFRVVVPRLDVHGMVVAELAAP